MQSNTSAGFPKQSSFFTSRYYCGENYDALLFSLPPHQGSPSSMSSSTSGPGAQHSYTFSGRVLLTAVLILAILTVVFVLIRLLLFQFVLRGRGSLAASVRRSFGRISSSRGLDAAALAALPVTAYRKTKADGAGSSTATADCAVCLSELDDEEKVRALPGCGHVFHVECVDEWLRSRTTCPVCRAEVAPAPPKDAEAAPPLFGGGGTLLVVTVQGGAAQTMPPSVLGSGQPAGGAGQSRLAHAS